MIPSPKIDQVPVSRDEGPRFVLFEGREAPSEDFANGFDCGRIWYRLRTEQGPFTETLCTDLRRRLIELSVSAGWRVSFRQIDRIWVEAHFSRHPLGREADAARKRLGL